MLLDFNQHCEIKKKETCLVYHIFLLLIIYFRFVFYETISGCQLFFLMFESKRGMTKNHVTNNWKA